MPLLIKMLTSTVLTILESKDILIVNDKVATIGENLQVCLPELETLDAKGNDFDTGLY